MPVTQEEEIRMKTYLETDRFEGRNTSRQFATFYVNGNLYGIDVMQVQEVTKPLLVTRMRTAPVFIKGLINLRGQIASAIGLSEMFGFQSDPSEKMTVVCKLDDVLLSLLVDRIGDVVEVDDALFEQSPQTIPSNIKIFMTGIYKLDGRILSIISLETILKELEKRCA